jgi:hypothetical protein
MSALFAFVSPSTGQVQLLDSTPAVNNVLYSAYYRYTACYINTDPGVRASFYS